MFNTVNTSLSGLWHQLYWCNFLTTVQKNPTMALTPPTQHPHTCESSRYLKEIHLLDKQKVSFYMETEGFNTKRSVLHKCSNSGKYGNVDMLGKKALRFLSCLFQQEGRKRCLSPPVSGMLPKSPCRGGTGTAVRQGLCTQCVVSEPHHGSPVGRFPAFLPQSKKSQDWKVRRVHFQKKQPQ